MTLLVTSVTPILRMHDVAVTKRFYVDYLGCSLDWEDGDGDAPIYMQVSRGNLVLHLSSHHDDGTPGSAVLVEVEGLQALHSELAGRHYPFLNPGLEPGPAGPEVQLIDPASNRIRFFERAAAD